MLKDITLGQYFPGNSIAHKLDPRTKILLVTLYIIALFSAKGWMGYAVMAVTLAVCVKVSHVGLRALVRGLKPLDGHRRDPSKGGRAFRYHPARYV